MGFTRFQKECETHYYETHSFLKRKGKSRVPGDIFLSDTYVVVDEAHHFRNLNNAMLKTIFALSHAWEVLNLTASVCVNDAEDILGMIALLRGSHSFWKSVEELKTDIEKWTARLASKDLPFIQEVFSTKNILL